MYDHIIERWVSNSVALGDNAFKLPHPKRSTELGVLEGIQQVLGELNFELLTTALKDLTQSKGAALSKLPPSALESLRTLSGLPKSQPMSVTHFESFLSPLRFNSTQGRIIDIDEGLDRMLSLSDIGAKCPAEFFRPPYSSIYLNFRSNAGNATINTVRGARKLEGAYVFEISPNELNKDISLVRSLGIPANTKIRGYEISLTGEPEGIALDDAFIQLRFYIPEDRSGDSLEELLEEHFRLYSEDFKKGLPDEDFEPYMESMKLGVFHIAKCLLVMNTTSVTKETINERSDLLDKIERSKKGKKAKLSRRLSRTYDRVVVRANAVEDVQASNDIKTSDSITRAMHWRRGHIRQQPYGPNRSKTKIIWIAPVLISGTGEDARRDYEVKA